MPKPRNWKNIGSADRRSETRLHKIFAQISSSESVEILVALSETLQELDSRNRLLDFEFEEDDGFEAAQEAPAPFSSTDGRNLFTTAEVNNALKREESDEIEQERVEDADVVRKGLRYRNQKWKEKKRKKKENEAKVMGIFGTSGKPTRWSLSHYLQSVASTREKRVVAVSAWLVALIGLIISLVFVTKDFLDSRKELASTVRYVENGEMGLPSLWLCTIDTHIPFFSNLPTREYKGQPLFWIDFFRGTSSRLNVTYPDTHKMPQSGVISVNARGQHCTGEEQLDPTNFLRENYVKPTCFHCITISRTPALIIHEPEHDHGNEEHEKKSGVNGRHSKKDPVSSSLEEFENPRSHAYLRLAQHSALSSCRRSRLGLAGIAFIFFRSEIKKHHKELSEKGILDFGGMDPTQNINDQYLWPRYRRGYRNGTLDFLMYDVVDMFCNVYLFSGVFYPATDNDVKYKFNSSYYRWERSGEGVYYPDVYESFYKEDKDIMPQEFSALIGGEERDGLSYYSGFGIHVMTNESRIGGAETFAVLEPNDLANLRLSRNLIYGKESFSKEVFRTKLKRSDVKAVNYVYYLELGFSTFLTKVVSDQLTVSWPAFIADFFGITSLFLDVSVYTLIVSPMVMRARKKAWVARKMRRRGQGVV